MRDYPAGKCLALRSIVAEASCIDDQRRLIAQPSEIHLLQIANYCDTGAAQGWSPFRFVITSARSLGARKLLSWLGKGKQIPRFARDDNS